MTFRIYGLPVAQGRPRAFRLPTGQIRMHDPASSRDWKRTIQAQLLSDRPPSPLAGPLVVTLTCILPRPKSLPKRVRHHVKRPDVSNLLKAVEDACTGIIWQDDAQIVRVEVTKGYAQAGEAPGVVIEVEDVP